MWDEDKPGKALGSQLPLESICPSPKCGLVLELILFHLSSDISYQMNYFSWETPGIGRYLTSLAIQGFSFLFLLFLIETNLLWRLRTLVCGICRRRKWVSEARGRELCSPDPTQESLLAETGPHQLNHLPREHPWSLLSAWSPVKCMDWQSETSPEAADGRDGSCQG